MRVFPAVSSKWSDVSFRDLRAEGGFVVAATREHGRTTLVRVGAPRGGKLRLRDPFGGSNPSWSRDDVVRDGSDWTVTLAAGDELAGALGDLPPIPPRQPARRGRH